MKHLGKRIGGILLALVMVLALLPGTLQTALAETEGDYEYSVTDGQAEITGYIGIGGDVVIPETLGGYPVTSIGYAFSGCTSLTSVTIPNSVTSIWDGAFRDCNSLTSVTIGSGVTSIEIGSADIHNRTAFSYCANLTNIDVSPENTAYASEDGVLFNKDKTDMICFPRGKAGAYTILGSMTSIGSYDFWHCDSLTSIMIPDSVTSTNISSYTFIDCASLTSIDVAEGNPVYASVDGVLFNKDKTEIICCPQGRAGAYTIPEGVTSIGRAFIGCTNLTSVSIPSSLINPDVQNEDWWYLTSSGFESCTDLTSISVSPENPTYASEDGVLLNKTKTCIIQFPQGKEGAYTIPSSVTSLQYGTFEGCASLTNVMIPGSVKSISPMAFGYCKSLTDVTIEEGVTDIGELMFYGCKSLTNITIPDSVTYIGASAFRACTGLTSITIPSKVTSIGRHAFSGCTSLTSVMFIGNAPNMEIMVQWGGFEGVTATVYYPANDPTWTEEVRQSYGGNLTWVAYEPGTNPTAEQAPSTGSQAQSTVAPQTGPSDEESITYKVLDTQNTAWNAEKGGALVVRSSADFSKFVEVRLDGKVLDKKNYEVKEGSTIVTVKAEYLATLGGGEHTLEIVSTDGVATASFTVTAAANTAANSANTNGVSSPKTGDTGLIALWLMLAIVSLAGAAIMILTDRKKRQA